MQRIVSESRVRDIFSIVLNVWTFGIFFGQSKANATVCNAVSDHLFKGKMRRHAKYISIYSCLQIGFCCLKLQMCT